MGRYRLDCKHPPYMMTINSQGNGVCRLCGEAARRRWRARARSGKEVVRLLEEEKDQILERVKMRRRVR